MRCFFLLFLGFTFSVYGQRTDFETIEFKRADSIATLYKGESIKNLPVLTHNLTASLATEVEKFRAIYTWVSTNIKNDYDSYLRTSKKRKKLANNREAYLAWNDTFTPKVFENLVKYRKTACTGYAYLLREMATLADFDCQIINGYGRTPNRILDNESQPNHSWNKIQLNGKWYLCDATWSAGRIMLKEDGPIFESDYYDGYFLADPVLFVKNHYPLKIDFTLLQSPPTFEQFLEGPVIYKEAFGPGIIPVSPKKMVVEIKKKDTVTFKLSIPESAPNKAFQLVLKRGNSSETVNPEIEREPGSYTLKYTFEKSGLYDVHITIDSVIIATYVVKVGRK